MSYTKRSIFFTLLLAFTGYFLTELAALYLDHIYPFEWHAVLHIPLDFITTFIAFSIFNIAWLMRQGLKDRSSRFILFFSLVFFSVGIIDFLHILVYEGMPDLFPGFFKQKGPYLWLLERYLIVISFLAAFFSDRITGKTRSAATGTTLFLSLAALPIFLLSSAIFPYIFSDYAFDPALFTRELEYVLTALYGIAFYCLWRRQAIFKNTIFLQLCYFLIFNTLSIIIFSFYSIEFDYYNLLGHIYKVLAYYFLYRAVALSGIADHFYTLSEMAQMSAEMLDSKTDIQPIMKIQLEKLQELLPQAERIVFYLHEEDYRFRVAYSWGRYDHLTPLDLKLCLKEFAGDLDDHISVVNDFPLKLSSLTTREIPEELAGALKSVHQAMLIPLTADGLFLGFIAAYIFNSLRIFSDRDSEKAAVFQKFASLSLAQVKRQELIKKLSYEDSLTGLPNRRAFFEALKKAEYDANRYDIPFTIVSLDMNGLKYINDNLGHAVGDQALRLISQTLLKAVRQSDTAARIGGDEFSVIYTHMGFKEGQDKVQELKRIFSYLLLPDHNHYFSMAVGAASYPEEGESEEAILNLADERMYAHKNEYKSDALI